MWRTDAWDAKACPGDPSTHQTGPVVTSFRFLLHPSEGKTGPAARFERLKAWFATRLKDHDKKKTAHAVEKLTHPSIPAISLTLLASHPL